MEHALSETGESVRVIEDCLNGRRTVWEDPYKPGRNGLVGLEQRIEINSPLSLVVLFLGTNDFQSMHQLNAWQSAQGVGTLISTICRASIEPGMPIPKILVVAPAPFRQAKGAIAPKFVDAEKKAMGFSEALQNVAHATECHFFDAGSVIETSKVDGVHLDEDQHQRLGVALAAEVHRIL
jgi:lysophospholipase L1-like esterase